MFTYTPSSTPGADFSKIGKGEKFSWHQFHTAVWGARNFEGHVLVALHNSTGQAVPLTWLLLDVQTTVDIITNPGIMVKNWFVPDEDAIYFHCNSGVKAVNQASDPPGYGTEWYEPTGIANILLMSRMTRKYQVVFDSKVGNFFRMIFINQEILFKLIPNGLYYFDSTDQENNLFLLSTVVENCEGFTRQEYEVDQEVRREMHLLVLPTKRDLGDMVYSNMIVNCPVTFQDLKNAKIIFGPHAISLKGKVARRKPASSVTDYVEILQEILESHKEFEVLTGVIIHQQYSIISEHQQRSEVHYDRLYFE